MISGVEKSPYQKGRKKSSFNIIGIFAQEKKKKWDWLKADCLFCPGRVIRYIIMATLKNPYCSNLSCIWFEDLRPPPFVPIIISSILFSIQWKLSRSQHIENVWMQLELMDGKTPPRWPSISIGGSAPASLCLQKHRRPWRSTRMDGEQGKFIFQKYFQDLKIPGAGAWGRILLQGEERQNVLYPRLFKIRLKIF